MRPVRATRSSDFHPPKENEMADYVVDVKAHTKDVNEAAVAAIVSYCGIALRGADSSLVSATDLKELATVRDGFAAKKLGLDAAAADNGICLLYTSDAADEEDSV